MNDQVLVATAKSFVPNEIFRRVRKIYLLCVVTAIPLLFLALLLAAHGIGYGIVPAAMLIAGLGLLVVAMIARAGARCPRCAASLIWKSGPIGTGRLSLGVKKTCPQCELDLDQPWQPEPPEVEETPG
jgi:hypothetical protein